MIGALSYRETIIFLYYRSILIIDKSLRDSIKSDIIIIEFDLENTKFYLKRLKLDNKIVVAYINSSFSIIIIKNLIIVKELKDLVNVYNVFTYYLKIKII